MSDIREIVLDTETTGFDPFRRGDRLVEIGCVELINHLPSGEVYHQYINPQRDMPPEAEKVHGLSIDFLSDKPVFEDVAQAFIDFIGDAPLVIHNAPFDMKFLNAELSWAARKKLPMGRAIDTLELARAKFPGAQNTLDALCRRFGVDSSKRVKHGALLDSEILAEVYLELIGGRQRSFGLDAAGSKRGGVVRRNYKPRPRAKALASLLSEEETRAHEAFIDEMGESALWRKLEGQ